MVIVTGSLGLIGCEVVKYFCERGVEVVGLDNNERKEFFGVNGCNASKIDLLKVSCGKSYTHYTTDISNPEHIEETVRAIKNRLSTKVTCIIHTAGQPSHDYASNHATRDYNVNVYGTHLLLEMFKTYFSDAMFIHFSTNKVYGDSPNRLEYRLSEN